MYYDLHQKSSVIVPFHSNVGIIVTIVFYLTIKLEARDFYRVMVDEGTAQVIYYV